MDRREFLRLAVGAAAIGSNWRLWAAPTGNSGARFLFVFLRGGYDALSALVPYGDAFYYESRPHIAIARPDTANPDSALKLDDRWGLHPLLADSMLPLYQRGQLVFVPFAGPDFLSRSHFQAQDWIELGQPPIPNPDYSSGFLNRLLARLSGSIRAVSFTQELPLVLRGGRQVVNLPITRSSGMPIEAGHGELIQQMYAGHTLESMVRDGMGLRLDIAQELKEEMQVASRGALPPSSFASEAIHIGHLLRDHPEYTLGFVDVGGWDTHVGQGGAHGRLANHLHNLGAGLNGLADAMGPSWQNTVVVVLSEFGRTFRENGNRGTDHGHGTTMWVLGGGLKSGPGIRGRQVALDRQHLNEDRDLPVLNEYRGLLGGLFQRMYGMSVSDLAEVFPRGEAIDIGLV